MTVFSRRNLLRATAVLPIGYVVGCTQLATVVSDATTIANGLSAVLPSIETVVGIGTVAAAKINTIISSIQSAASALTSATAGTGALLAQQIAAGVGALTSAVSGFALPSWVMTVVQAAGTLVPLVLQVAGVALADAPTDPKAIDQARAVLIAAAAR